MQDACELVYKVERRSDGYPIVSKPVNAKYEKLGNAGIEGTSFQIDLLTVFLLNAVERTKNWRLSTENREADKFDDVVFESLNGDILLQAKHKQKGRKITLEDLLSTNPKHSDFSLPQFFFAYQSVKNKFRIQNVIICTNSTIQMDKHTRNLVAAQSLNTEHMLYFPGVGTICHNFNHHIKSELKASIEKYLEENLRGKNISAEIISDDNIDDYLRHLQFIANYPCGREIEKIMENIISHLKWSQNLDGETCMKFIRKKIEDWYKDRKGRYLTQAYGKAYFCEIRAKHFYDGLKRYGIYFEDTEWSLSFKLLHIIPRDTYIFNAVKILQALENTNLKEILCLNLNEPRIFQMLVVEAFELPQYTHLLILSSEDRQTEIIEEIVDKILILLNSFEYKKIILISHEDDQLAKKIKSTYLNFYKAVFDSVVFTDFTKETCENFRKKSSIVFQGKNMCLNEMCVTDAELNNLLCPKLLEKLAKGEKIKIGSELLMDDIENLYIPRSFTRNGSVFAEQDMCQLDSAFLKVILISNFAGMGKSFVLTKLSVLLKKKYPHLWIIRIDFNMHTKYLRQCTKNLATISILDFLNSIEATKLKNSLEMGLFSLDGRIVLMMDGVDEIGPDYTEVVFKLLSDCNANRTFKKIFITTRPHLQKRIEDILNVESFSLKPFSMENQIDFIKCSLETRMDVQDHIKRAKCKVYAESLVTRMALWLNEDKNTFAGIPLQTRMLAEVFQERALSSKDDLDDWEGFKEFLTSGADAPKMPRKINLVRLYQMFVDKKRDIFIYEKGNTNGNFLAEEGLEIIFKECQVYHCALALQIVLDKYQSKTFQLHTDKCENYPEKNVLKIGIVQKIGENIQFIHRTFAEYFVAETILVELRRRSQDEHFQEFFVKELLVYYEFNVVRTFLDSLIKKEVCTLPRVNFEPYHFLNCEKSTNLRNFLHVLAEEGCLHILRFLIECLKYRRIAIDLNVRGRNDETPLHKAAKNGHLSVVQLLLEQGADVDAKNATGCNTLDCAVREGHLNVVRYLIELEKTVNVKEDPRNNALICAADKGHLNIVKYLIEKEVNVKGDLGCNALECASRNGRLNVVRYLIEKGVNVTEATKCHPLNSAALTGQLDVVKYLLENMVNVKEATKYNLLNFAALNGHLNVVRYVTEKGVKVEEDPGCHPLNFAAINGHLNVVKYLIEGVSVEEDLWRSLPNLADLNGHLNVLRYLIEEGENVKESPWCHPLNLAALDGHLNVVMYLVQKGVKVEEVSWYQPLNLAALNGHLNVVRYLIEKGINVNEIPGCHPLDFAALNGHLNVVTYLIEKGVTVKESPGYYSIDVAASNDPLNVIRFLIEEEVNVNEAPKCRALDFAASNGHLNIVKYLIEKGIKLKDVPLCHPLNLAAFNGRIDVVRFLLDYGVDVNAKNSYGYTALHYAASGGHLNVVEFLTERGSDINLANKHGATALHCAEEKGALDVAKFLREKGADLHISDK